jgi:hypothetical protein
MPKQSPTLHLIKLSVGPESLSDLVEWQEGRLKQLKKVGKKLELIHVTRHKPKREEEVLAGGSIYWVIKGRIVARQKLLEFRNIRKGDSTYCGLVYDPKMIPVDPRAHRAFQGWRYFKPADAPRDLSKREADHALPEDIQRELAEFGVL